MATTSRAALLTKTHKVLKKHYTSILPSTDRPLLQQLLFASCLENSTFEAAEKVFAQIETSFIDLNETRVSSITELAELTRGLHDPLRAAASFKGILQSVFEAVYSFEIESFKKMTIGQATKELHSYDGSTPFVVSYATQFSFGGHSIPIDKAALETLFVLGVITRKDADEGKVPGLERAIPKNKGIEFGSLLHQLSVDFLAKPHNTDTRAILLSIAADAKERMPKRGAKKKAAAEADAKKKAAKSAAKTTTKKTAAAGKKSAAKTTDSKSTKKASGGTKRKAATSKTKTKTKAGASTKRATSKRLSKAKTEITSCENQPAVRISCGFEPVFFGRSSGCTCGRNGFYVDLEL